MSQPRTAAALLEAVAAQAQSELAPLVAAIDREGVFPADYLHRLGALGGFGASVPRTEGGLGFGVAEQIEVTTRVGSECGATAFLVWCQSTCAWYLQHAPNPAVRERYLRAVAGGTLLAGTGMSNAVKHLAGLEKIHLQARRDGDGYIVSGALPWVSNVGVDHLAIAAAAVDNGGYVMFAVRGDANGLSLHACPEFSGLEGTRTLNLRFKEVRIADDRVLAHPHQFAAYLARIKAGFVLGQTGIGFGIIQGSLKTIRESNVTHAAVNAFLDHQGDQLAAELAELTAQAATLARQAQSGDAPILEVLKVRARTSELTLKAAHSAVLHAGAKGYQLRHPAQRRLREAVFVAIVTPALKHLRKEISDLTQAASTQLQAEAA
ncbi:MAG TPA: acyl-CoA dehydrogenase family protein [Burkholderiaceae bacterium]|nr:acyl-CoA dehydrogenase family protein [Burkholderiaceae bacterium]